MMTRIAIRLDGISKQYPGTNCGVRDISLTVPAGSLLALLGPSGCGKTTTLRLIAGLERPDSGRLELDEQVVSAAAQWVPPEQRRVGLVFQEGALFPHLTVAENIAFALPRSAAQQRKQRIHELLELVDLLGMERRYPHQLSGGQQQRVALARALAPQPSVVLLDEPFANLDAALRNEVREEVLHVLRLAATTAVLVTHDQEEALSVADHVALLLDGRMVQHGTPYALYNEPANRAAASFVGAANWISGEASGMAVQTALGRSALRCPQHGLVSVLIRPEQVHVHPDAQGDWRIERVRYFGHDQLITIRHMHGAALTARLRADDLMPLGACVTVAIEGLLSAFAEGVAAS